MLHEFHPKGKCFKRSSPVDLGGSKRHQDENGACIKQAKPTKHTPTTEPFYSRTLLRGLSQSRRDDMEILGYVLLDLGGFRLPWDGWSLKNRPPIIEEQNRLCGALDVVVRK